MDDIDFENNPYYRFVTSTGERKSIINYFSEVNVFFQFCLLYTCSPVAQTGLSLREGGEAFDPHLVSVLLKGPSLHHVNFGKIILSLVIVTIEEQIAIVIHSKLFTTR